MFKEENDCGNVSVAKSEDLETFDMSDDSPAMVTDLPEPVTIPPADDNHNEIPGVLQTLHEKGPPKIDLGNLILNGLLNNYKDTQNYLQNNKVDLNDLEQDADDDSDDEGKLQVVLNDGDEASNETASPLTNGTIKEEDLTPLTEYCIKCPQCQKGMQTFQALKEHVECCHMDISNVSEPIGLTVPSAVSPTPTLVGTGGPFGCSQCTTTFTSKDQLEKHELLHSPNAQVSCKVCNKTFANVYRLQRHMISHDESAVLRKFKCTECEKAFKFKHHLKEHIRIHSGEKPFECGNCGKRFSHSGSYSSHMTSKKCLVMNVKLGRTRAPSSNTLLDKNTQQNLRGPKRPAISPINNNLATSPNHNSYLSILPKYPEAAVAFLQNSGIPPCFIGPPSLLNAHAMTSYPMPSLTHILEQLQQQHQHQQQQQQSQSPIRPSYIDNCDSTRQTETNPNFENSSNHSAHNECGDLIMDEDGETEIESKQNSENQTNTGDLEAVKRILETVNATVTKELLQANMQKMSSDTSSECHSVASVQSPKSTPKCSNCNKILDSVEQHECEDVKSEGLAAKLEGAFTTKSEDVQNGSISGEEQDYERNYNTNDEIDSESFTTTDHVSEDGRKVRVRSLISDEQLKVLKDHYKVNPRPKREDLEKIAARLNFSVRVVQVWFQNTRARDRREGKLIQVPYSPLPSSPRYGLPSKPHISMSPSQYISEQPLDLSIKREVSAESSPASSPNRHLSDTNDEVVNLSRKNSRSPYLPFLNHYQNSNSSEPRRSPSPLEFNSSRLAQILAQPAHKLGLPGMGLVPMEQLMQFRGADLPSLSQLINNRISSMSPNEKRSWADARDVSSDIAEDELSNASRSKMSQYVLSNQDMEVEGQFTCNQCDKAFSKQSSLARHKYEHSGQRPHKCDQCTKAFKHKHHLTEHKRLHSGEKPFQCGKCMKRFSHSGSYSQHMNHRYSYCKPYRE